MHRSAGLPVPIFTFGLASVFAPNALGSPEATPCDSRAEVFFHTGPLQQNELSFCMILDGVGGAGPQQLSFVSGTNLSAITAAINTLAGATGVVSEQSVSNPERIRLYSTAAGATAFVSVQQTGGNGPNVFAISTGGSPMWQFIAHGKDGLPGDSNCDANVNVADLINVAHHWGICPPQPASCLGDVNIDQCVDVSDLLMVIANWGATL
jgi:hypothetical protein